MINKHIVTSNNTETIQGWGMKSTHARMELLSFLSNSNRPASVAEILSYLKSQDCDTNKVTVYRTLDSFVKKGIASRLEFQDGKYRYELHQDDHHHLICECCGSIDTISDCSMEAFAKQIMKEKDFVVMRHALEFFGLCSDCYLKE